MRIIRLFFLIIIVAALTEPVAAQSRRLNPNDLLDLAVYCAGENVDIYHIDANGAGQQALFATAGEVSAALSAAFNSGGPVAVKSGGFNTTLTALPGVRLRASQSRDGRAPYAYEFAGDTCAPFVLNQSITASAAQTTTTSTVSGATTPSSTAATGNITYTVARGDSFYRIARRFDITINELAAANGTIPSDILFPGQTMIIPNQIVEAAPAVPGEPAAPAAPGVPALFVDGSGNYLQDGSFEGLYTGRGSPDLNIPGPWGLQVFTSPRAFEWQNLQPFAFPRRDQPIHGGNLSLNINRGYATFSVALFQRVSVPENARLEAGAFAFYDTCEADRSRCDNDGNPSFRVGVDPNGGTSPFEGDIAWGPFIAPQGTWGASTVTTTAQGSVVTVFITASQERPRAINELFIDDAYLRVR